MRKTLLIILIAQLLIGCGGKKDDPTPDTSPGSAVLLSPASNSLCTSGAVVNGTQSTVLFNWNAAANTSSYDLTITNLLTSASTTQNFISNQAYVTIQRNTPYSWYVTSKSASSPTTAKSDTWKFYNAGEGAVSYAPFPATIISPVYAEAINATGGIIKLGWSGSSVATGGVLTYDLYFGTTVSPSLFKSNITDSFLNVEVASKTTYYWKVVTKDAAGNSSDSVLYQFFVN